MKKILVLLLLAFVISEKTDLIKVEGEEFEIKLAGNPTTGYNWYLDNLMHLNYHTITPLNLSKSGTVQYIPAPNPDKLNGVGGNYIFKFKANKASEKVTILRFIYKRGWTKGFAKEKIYKVKVVQKLN